ncbi:hypothetical protein F8388_008254 [Cannabis sativa]|nr:hypothetical protein F8388_008254 [Cannabis sativa]
MVNLTYCCHFIDEILTIFLRNSIQNLHGNRYVIGKLPFKYFSIRSFSQLVFELTCDISYIGIDLGGEEGFDWNEYMRGQNQDHNHNGMVACL